MAPTGDFTPVLKNYFGDFDNATFLYVYDDGSVCGRNNSFQFVAMSLEKQYAPWAEFKILSKEETEVQLALGTLSSGGLASSTLVEVWIRKQ